MNYILCLKYQTLCLQLYRRAVTKNNTSFLLKKFIIIIIIIIEGLWKQYSQLLWINALCN